MSQLFITILIILGILPNVMVINSNIDADEFYYQLLGLLFKLFSWIYIIGTSIYLLKLNQLI